jgi:SynChlorMet cassette protein ScmD
MKLSKLPIANPLVVLREEFDDYAILFNPDTADAVGLNPVGVAVWKQLDGKNTLEDILKEIQVEFSDTPETAPDEIQKFIDELAEHAFVGYEVESV